jgi:hypothetical protein
VKDSQDFYRVALNAVRKDVPRISHDEFAGAGDAAGSAGARMRAEPLDGLEDTANDQSRCDLVVRRNIGGFLTRWSRRRGEAVVPQRVLPAELSLERLDFRKGLGGAPGT